MREFLCFRLYGPLASWGDVAVGEVRPTDLRPSRSALLGLLAAALGLLREDDASHRALGEELRFGVHVVSAGLPLTDYHTIQSLPRRKKLREATRADQLRGRRDELDTIVSTRQYRCDSCYRIVAWNLSPEPAFSLQRLRQALERPHFVLYLGRKSCPPGASLQPQLVSAETVVEALRQVQFQEIEGVERGGSGLYWEDDPDIAGPTPTEQYERRDDPLSRQRWSFRRRREYYAELPAATTAEEVSP